MRFAIRNENTSKLRNQEGKGTVGCLVSLVLLGLGTIVGIQMVPLYYSYKSLETDVKSEAARAGAHFFADETLINNILLLAKRNDVHLTRENVKVERFAGQLHININYKVPVDFHVYEREMEFSIRASSYIGRL